tara:strand:+ start:1 stop:1437 length:1437 start_codon:yes stop_codon:yes gene_type:complete
MANPYADALSKSNVGTGITSLMMRNFINSQNPTSQADAISKLNNMPEVNPGMKNFLQMQFAKPEYSLQGIQSLNQTRDANTAAYEAKEALGYGKGDYTTFSDTPLWEKYGFATPGAEYVRLGQFNAKNMPFASPGVGIANTGVTRENIFPTLQGLYDQWGQYEGAGFKGGNKMGGNKSNWDALKSWNTGDRPESAGSIASPYGSKDALQTYLTTGQITPELNPEYALEAYDYAQRETARQQQRKPGSFLQQFGGALSDIGGPVLQTAGALTGNPALIGAGTALKSGGKLARGQGFGSVLADAGQDWLTSGAPFPGSTTLGPLGRGALSGGITAARGGDLNESLMAGASGYYAGQDYGSYDPNAFKNLTPQKAAELAKQATMTAGKRIGTTIGINYLAPPKELPTYDYPEPTTNAAVAAQNSGASPNIGGISGLSNLNQSNLNRDNLSTQGVDPIVFRGIGALGPAFMNVYERAARGLS